MYLLILISISHFSAHEEEWSSGHRTVEIKLSMQYQVHLRQVVIVEVKVHEVKVHEVHVLY